MATVTGLTASRMLEIENMSVVDGEVDLNGHLLLTKYDGTIIDAGIVVGPAGPQGDPGTPGVAGVSSIPGEIKAWPNTVLPVQATYGKWVWADGAVYSSATYPIASGHIHSAWKTAYGQSDPGAGNFRVPDLRGLILAGLDAMPGGSRANRMTRSVAITIAAKTGEETHIVTIAEMPAHGHSVTDPGHSHAARAMNGGATNGGYLSGAQLAGDYPVAAGDAVVSAVTGISIQNAGSGGAHENVQPTVFVPYIVRLDG